MKLSDKQKAILKSYARGVLTAITPLIAIHCGDVWAYIAAVFAGVISPAIRAWDKNDPAFGRLLDAAQSALNNKAKVANPDIKK